MSWNLANGSATSGALSGISLVFLAAGRTVPPRNRRAKPDIAGTCPATRGCATTEPIHGRSPQRIDHARPRPRQRHGDAGQARPDHGGDQRPLARLGHRRRLRRTGRGTGVHLPGGGAGAPRAATGGVGRLGPAVPVRRGRRGQHRRGVRGAARAVGRAGFPGPRDRLRRQGSICAGAIWTRRARRSCRRWTSPATRSSRWRSARCR